MATKKEKRLQELLQKIPAFTRRDLLLIPELKNNPISAILIRKFTKDSKIDLQALVLSLYNFTESKTLDDKLNFLFHLYDTDGDGSIAGEELFDILKVLNRGILEDEKLQNIVAKTMAEVCEYGRGMNYKQFKRLLTQHCRNIIELFNCEY